MLALFYCSIFINMNRLFAFIIGCAIMVIGGLYGIYEIVTCSKGTNNGSKSKSK
jgi:hypothetical protein